MRNAQLSGNLRAAVLGVALSTVIGRSSEHAALLSIVDWVVAATTVAVVTLMCASIIATFTRELIEEFRRRP